MEISNLVASSDADGWESKCKLRSQTTNWINLTQKRRRSCSQNVASGNFVFAYSVRLLETVGKPHEFSFSSHMSDMNWRGKVMSPGHDKP